MTELLITLQTTFTSVAAISDLFKKGQNPSCLIDLDLLDRYRLITMRQRLKYTDQVQRYRIYLIYVYD